MATWTKKSSYTTGTMTKDVVSDGVDIYFEDTSNDEIVKYDTALDSYSVIGTLASFEPNSGIVAAGDGHLCYFGGSLYVLLNHFDVDDSTQVWRYSSGTTWVKVF